MVFIFAQKVDANGDNICKKVEKEVEEGEERLIRLKQRDRTEVCL